MRRWPAIAALLAGGCASTPTAPPPAAFVFPVRLQALGTEPFWSLAIDGDRIDYSTPEISGQTARIARSEEGGALNLTGSLAGQAITARITPEPCSDGMSDRSYPYKATVRLGAQLLQGCARDRAQGAP